MHAEKREDYVTDVPNEIESDLAHCPDAEAPGMDPVVRKYVSDASVESAAEAAESDSVIVGRGIAEVLFPATPPAPVNARLIKRFGLEDERKPRGLASAAGWYRPAEPGSN